MVFRIFGSFELGYRANSKNTRLASSEFENFLSFRGRPQYDMATAFGNPRRLRQYPSKYLLLQALFLARRHGNRTRSRHHVPRVRRDLSPISLPTYLGSNDASTS